MQNAVKHTALQQGVIQSLPYSGNAIETPYYAQHKIDTITEYASVPCADMSPELALCPRVHDDRQRLGEFATRHCGVVARNACVVWPEHVKSKHVKKEEDNMSL